MIWLVMHSWPQIVQSRRRDCIHTTCIPGDWENAV
jgi:hypothetical protein